ncbi:MAG: hypothetical protein PHQ86_00115 [Dehalococcoidales bacterium]|nr:hypothetical protein [Dehalococcoidales bacterium]
MPELPEIFQALTNPKAYPEKTQIIQLIQTQMSFVFLTDNYVYKVKKPVNLGYLDYTTLEKRHILCQREVELNRRLCPEVYLGVVPIIRDKGNISIEGQGEIIEYAVKMRRLPQDQMMDILLAKNQVSLQMITKVAQKMAEFHKQAKTNADISAFGNLDIINRNTEENFSQTQKYIGKTISGEVYQHIKSYTDNFIKQNGSLFQQRITNSKIKDNHGDLHAAHICFTKNGICIYDCIEFNDRFRYCDVASEVAFLAMDLDHYGHHDLSRNFVNSYIIQSGDEELRQLLNFYKCYLAYVRGKVEGFKLDDPYIPKGEKERILGIARDYFKLAESYVSEKK